MLEKIAIKFISWNLRRKGIHNLEVVIRSDGNTFFQIECPYEDLVYLSNESFTGEGESGMYPCNKEELQILINSYKEAIKVFSKNNVKITVHSNYLYDNYNEDDFSLDEFLNNYKLIEN